ncbi:sensor histidine kinase [uncultured Maribacter sp.]|uniref:sensor histidine kinase n=1 Tax=uncultured Maribacter sp. TaxID=431308 RepID=UPI002612F9FD|nr:sensor histidine kinase [uncultured Maribacter sp.]
MHKPILDQERQKNKISLILKVNYISSALSIILSIICFYALNIKEIVPETLLIFGIVNLINSFFFKKHKNINLTYNISLILALVCTLIVTLYTGGIHSSFIFILALIVFAGYANTRKYGQIYLSLIFLLVILIFSQSASDFTFTRNVIPEKHQSIFSLLSVLFSIYLLGNVFGKNLLNTHNTLYNSKNDLSKKLLEKETLLKEIHHRVKNNLQTVSSLLSLQTRNTQDDNVKTLLKATKDRVISMAMIHEMLYMREDLSKIEYKTYVEELSQYLIKSIKGIENKIQLTIDIPDIKLGIDTAIPLGLLINEAVTNALKYGIVDDNEGEIHIAITKEVNKEYVLKIGDNGIGFPETINHKNTKSLGLKLIYNLTRQLKGSVIRDVSKKGTNYIIKFQEIGQQLHPVV